MPTRSRKQNAILRHQFQAVAGAKLPCGIICFRDDAALPQDRMIVERVRAGVARAKASAPRAGKPSGALAHLRPWKSESVRLWRLLGGQASTRSQRSSAWPRAPCSGSRRRPRGKLIARSALSVVAVLILSGRRTEAQSKYRNYNSKSINQCCIGSNRQRAPCSAYLSRAVEQGG